MEISYFIRKSRFNQGFTLIELLVVVAIIAILAAILFPVFGRARENARRTSCLSNIKQVSLVFQQYTQDYDETFPQALYNTNTTGTLVETLEASRGWYDIVEPYAKSIQLFQCPSERNGYNASDPNTYTDYSLNAALSWNGSTSAPTYNSGIKLSAVLSPTLTILNAEASNATRRVRNNGCDKAGNTNNTKPAASAAACGNGLATELNSAGARHLEGINLSFVDGHAKWYKSEATNTSAKIYNVGVGLAVSGQNPTFNAILP